MCGYSTWLFLALGFAGAPAVAAEVVAEAPTDLAVTVYRAPYRRSGSFDLNRLNGFALVSETRVVRLPAGRSQVRFEGVADGIEPASAIVTGFPAGVIEKNREGALLSPSALIAATAGKSVTLLRSFKKTGKTERLDGSILSDAAGGVVFQTSQGIEALRCSGLPETFSFSPATGLAARPTLSVLVRTSVPVIRSVMLSYLAWGFDWSADYIATLSADGRTMDLGAWVSLANGNGVGFPAAHTQVVAGRVNRESSELLPIDAGGTILALCWPRGSTSDSPAVLQLSTLADARMAGITLAAPMTAALMQTAGMALRQVEQEQLGDLKLYRVPERTTLASRQSKQVRLMDRAGIPVTLVYGGDFAADTPAPTAPASRLLRTKNDSANHLGLPLPSGRVAVFAAARGEILLEHEAAMRDLAVGEEVEIDMGPSPDVQVAVTKERSTKTDDSSRVDISNALGTDIQFELQLRLRPGAHVVHADHPAGAKNGRPIFRLRVPANGTTILHYQTRHPVS